MLFGAVVGSVIGCLWNSVHSPEQELLEQLCAFRDCGKICHRLLVEFRPQPRKRAFGAILYFSGLWQDLSLAACGIPSTAPKTSFWSNCVLFGAVVRSVIGFLWNSVHSPENKLLQQLFAFRGCGKICHWLLVEFRPQPRKRAFGAILCFSGLWQDLTSTFCIHWLLLEFRPQPRKRAFEAILCFAGLWLDLTSTFFYSLAAF